MSHSTSSIPICHLLFSAQGGAEIRLSLALNQRYTFGRSRSSDIVVQDELASKTHCEIVCENEKIMLYDCNSSNGTFVNEKRIKEIELSINDVVVIGHSSIRVIATPESSVIEPENKKISSRLSHGLTISLRRQAAEEKFIGTSIDSYYIERFLGQGGAAYVFQGKDTNNQEIAIKILARSVASNENHMRRFLREARAGARLSHKNLVAIHHAGHTSDGIYYLIMEYVHGDTAMKMLQENGSLEVNVALNIAIDVADALGYAHSKNFVHRDIKPSNIIVDKITNTTKLVDLGLAKCLESSGASRVTQAGVGVGTLDYISPEQILDAANVNASADIFSLGATIYAMICGGPAFIGRNPIELVDKIRNSEIEWPQHIKDSIPRRLVNAISIAMAKKPELRYASMNDFRNELISIHKELNTN